MTMQGARMVGEPQVFVDDRDETGWSQDEDPEHFSDGLHLGKEDLEIDLSRIVARGEGWSIGSDGETESLEDAELFLDSVELRAALDDADFRIDLKRACQWAFHHHSQSTYASWEDLQQEVIMRFARWLPHYRKQAKWRTVLVRIAKNLLIDAHRSEVAGKRRHEEIDFDGYEVSMVAENSGARIEDRIFLKECRQILSEDERAVFDEFFVYGKSLRQLANKHGVSPTAMSKRWARIMAKLHIR